jgi:hypothetical protein
MKHHHSSLNHKTRQLDALRISEAELAIASESSPFTPEKRHWPAHSISNVARRRSKVLAIRADTKNLTEAPLINVIEAISHAIGAPNNGLGQGTKSEQQVLISESTLWRRAGQSTWATSEQASRTHTCLRMPTTRARTAMCFGSLPSTNWMVSTPDPEAAPQLRRTAGSLTKTSTDRTTVFSGCPAVRKRSRYIPLSVIDSQLGSTNMSSPGRT